MNSEKIQEKTTQEDEEEFLKDIKEEILLEDEEVKEEKILTLSLREVKKAPLKKRSKKAINLIKEEVLRYTKQKEVWIDNHLNEKIWERGIEKPPHKIKLRVLLTNKDRALIFLFK